MESAGVADGASAGVASAIGSMLAQGDAHLSPARATDAAVQWHAANCTSDGSSRNQSAANCTGSAALADEGAAVRPQVARRAAQLVQAAASLSSAIGRLIVAGEPAVKVATPELSMSVDKRDPCAKAPDGTNQTPTTAPALSNGVTGSFLLPAGSACGVGDGAAAQTRRRLQAQGGAAPRQYACDDGEEDLQVMRSPAISRSSPHCHPAILTPIPRPQPATALTHPH